MTKISEGYVDSLATLIRRDSRPTVGANFVLWVGNFRFFLEKLPGGKFASLSREVYINPTCILRHVKYLITYL